ncbi:MAG: PASTA domain-containing protein [Treponema sp.]|jgi:beta-lactam-binding protein with PASTA domain|nr:PASTA domain-containing protein [Treponema sp.]
MTFKKFSFDLEGLEDYIGNHLRLFISFTIGVLVFVALIALSVFFITVQGKEEVMVPDVLGTELTQALIELQEKELYPRIQLRPSGGGEERGIVLEQSPEAGTLVKAERRIDLVISQGMALDKLGDYVGKNIGDVRADVLARNSQSQEIIITFREPFMYQYSAEAAGTVLQQNPAPGSDLTGPITLELVVSRGQENARVTVPNFVGLSLADTMDRLSQVRAGFTFSMRNPEAGESAGSVYSQDPLGGTEIRATDRITINITAPQVETGEITGLFRYNLPVNPYPLPVTVDVQLPGGARRNMVSVNYPGGEFIIPYSLPAGSVIILSMLDRELYRQTIKTPVEALSTDGL